jgi:two-component system sensor histidine kinase KdpD
VLTTLSNRRWLGYLLAALGIALVNGVLRLFGSHVNPTTVALALLLVVLLVATGWGARPAVLASILGVICFNFFYLPPVWTFRINDSDNWIALFAFLLTAIIAGRLSTTARRRAEEADAGRREIERLYHELQDTFERSSQAKALKQSERLKSALLDAVTHDLRTPLTSIKASVTTLLEERHVLPDGRKALQLDDEGRKEMLDVINEEADRLDHFIEGLMDLARIEAGEMHLRRNLTSIEEIVGAALTRAAPRTRNHRMEVWIQDELPAIRLDERAVAEVIYTLVDNAARYSAPGSVIRVTAEPGDRKNIRLTVSDEGTGIPRELRERVFDKFFRAMRDGDTGHVNATGSGMGLTIARGIVEAHGGRIWIDAVDGSVGTRVLVELPIGNEDNPAKPYDQFVGLEHGK